MRDTKIVATLGPASSDEQTLREMIRAGVNVVRINFSHGAAQDHIDRVNLVRRIAEEEGVYVGVLADLQGPKIRIAMFEEKSVVLSNGAEFVFDTDSATPGNVQRVGLDYPELIKDVTGGDILLLDDGKIRMKVLSKNESSLRCVVEQGGVLSNRKGINKLGGGLSAAALTSKDMTDILTAAAFEADFLAVSFPKNAADMYMARELMRNAGGTNALMIAKIERAEAIPNLEEILEASDGIMVARGDLAVEVGDAKVPALQKKMIRMAREKNKLSITATQMMESMITSHVPTRAEVSDVANAVLDGTDAVMLSAETASGAFPIETVRVMAQVCVEAASFTPINLDQEMVNRTFGRIDQSVAMAAMFTAYHFNANAILCMTESGSTALWMSRFNSGVPILCMSRNIHTLRRLSLYRTVSVVPMPTEDMTREHAMATAEALLMKRGLLKLGDLVVTTSGSTMGKIGGSDTMLVRRIGS
ncbi:pyruvate kinase [Formosimonas limnophila]|uniref:Pyruvate kinase n=2 Tax=Formosimonas limnophila TaxID=1384487 RepID=A0A8J3CKS5_9BURK|nr:pyruvate kinase [Formosimonas limnophila]